MPLRLAFHGLWRPHFFPENMRQLFWAMFLFHIAQGLFLIAGPIFLFSVGKNLLFAPIDPIANGVLFVFLYVIVLRLTVLLAAKPLSLFMARFGFVTSMLTGLFLEASRYALYPFFTQAPVPIFLANAIAAGLGLLLFWIPYHTYFATESALTKTGREVGTIEFITKLAQIITPLLGAIISSQLGFYAVSLLGGAFFAGSMALMAGLPNMRSETVWHYKDLKKWLSHLPFRRAAIAWSAFEWEERGIIMFWPVFLFIAFGRLETAGYIVSSATFLSLLFIYLSGWAYDHIKTKSRWQRASGVLWSLLWIPRGLFAHLPFALVFIDSLDRLAYSVYGTIFHATLISRSRGKHIFLFYLNNAVFSSFITVVGLSILSLLLFWQWQWWFFFATFAAAGLMSLILTPQDRARYG